MTEPLDLNGLEGYVDMGGSLIYEEAKRLIAELRALRAENQRLRETRTTSRVVDMPDGQRSIVIEQGVETLEFKYERLRKAAEAYLYSYSVGNAQALRAALEEGKT